MQPRQVSEGSFKTYPPLARKFATDHLELIRDLPVVLAAWVPTASGLMLAIALLLHMEDG